MKIPRSSLERPKATTVMANPPKRSLDLLGNRRKSTSNKYVADLRLNNAKLATSLATEKKKYSKMFQSYTALQEELVGQKAELRAVASTAKAGLQKFQSALDLMIEASDLICAVNLKIGTLCPELVSVQQPSVQLGWPNQSHSPAVPVPIPIPSASVAPKSIVARGSPGTSTPVHGTARPMVQGQVISTNPTISLQRVNAPVRLGQGTSRVPAQRGVDINLNNFASSRLSDISEDSNSTSGRISVSPRSNLPSHSTSPTTRSMPESHVVLERLLPAPLLNPADLASEVEEEEQLTVVHFGSLNFSSPSHLQLNFSPEKTSPSISGSIRALPSLSPQKTEPSPGTSKLEESSSEDESVALKIVESKRSYLERERQLESKEGTSWNYDEAGKFHKRPPRKRRSKQLKSPISGAVDDRNQADESVDKSKEIRDLRSLEAKETPRKILKTEGIETAGEIFPEVDPLDFTDTTNNQSVDMSFTCMTSNGLEDLQLKNKNQDDGESKEDSTELPNTIFKKDGSARKIFVTQRSRRNKSAPNFDLDQTIEQCNLSLVDSERNIVASDFENNENSPPTPRESSVTNDKIYSHHNVTMPYVVLECLPSNTVQVNCKGSDTLKRKKTSAPDKVTKQKESSCTSESNLSKEHTNSSFSPNRKRSLSETPSSSSCTEAREAELKQNRSKPGPKRSKQSKRNHEDEASLEPKAPPSAPTSPISSRNGDISGDESVDNDDRRHRPRRNAAPVNLKERKLGSKLRRP